MLGSSYDFDSRVRTTIAVDTLPYLYYTHQVETYSRLYSSLKAHGLKYMAYMPFSTLETDYRMFLDYYGLKPEDVEKDITGVNIEGKFFRFPEPEWGGWPTRGFTSRSLWREILLNITRLVLDAGADMIVYDIGWGSVPSALAGEIGEDGDAALYCFDEESIIGFREYLMNKYSPEELRERFGIADISSFNFTRYLREREYTTNLDIEKLRYENQLPEEQTGDLEARLLWREFEKYHLKSTLDFYDELRSDLKNRARRYGRDFWIAANLKPTLSYHYSEGMMSIVSFLAHIDFPYFEVFYDDIQYPRRTPAPLFRTILAAGKHFAVMTSPTPSFYGDLSPGDTYSERQDLATAEVIAFGGWPQTSLHNLTYIKLVELHPELLPKKQDGQLALIYSLPSALNLNEYYQEEAWGYLPFESAFYLLSDVNEFSFDVVVFGDKEFNPQTPALDELLRYKALILPVATCLSDDQVELLLQYVSKGGIIIGFGPIGLYDENGFPARGRQEFTGYFSAAKPLERVIHSFGKGRIVSLASSFLTEYYLKRNELYGFYEKQAADGNKRVEWIGKTIGPLLAWFKETLSLIGVQPDVSTNLNPLVGIVRYWDPSAKAMILHFLNYEYDLGRDTALTQLNANLSILLRPELRGKILRVRFYSPENPHGIELKSFLGENGWLNVVIPELHVWGVLRIEEAKPEEPPHFINTPTEVSGYLRLNSSLIVNSTLTIANATIVFQGGSATNLKIEVLKGGRLEIINSTIRCGDENSRYYIKISGGELLMENSVVEGAGKFGLLDQGGVWIRSKEAVLINCTFRDCYQYGVFLMEADYTIVKDCRFLGCPEGMMIYQAHFVKVINCSFSRNSIGLYAKHAYNLEVARCCFEDNEIFGCIIDRSYFPIVRDSFFTGSRWDGLSFWTSIFARTINCTSTDNGIGFAFQNTPVLTLLNSDSVNNRLSGILLREVDMWGCTPPPLMLGYIDMPWISWPEQVPYSLRGDYLPSQIVMGDVDGRVLITHCNIKGNGNGVTLDRLWGFNGYVRIANNTINNNSVGLILDAVKRVVIVGNNIVDNEIEIFKANIISSTINGNYWGEKPREALLDSKPLRAPNENVEDVSDLNPPLIFLLSKDWETEKYFTLVFKVCDETTLLTNPVDELIWVSLVKPRPIEDVNYWGWYGIFNQTATYKAKLPETLVNPREATIKFQTDFFADLSPEERRFIKYDIYASDIYGNWGVSESKPPHMLPVHVEGLAGAAEIYVAVFEQSQLRNITLLYSLGDVKGWNRSAMHYDEKSGLFKAHIKGLPSGKIKFRFKIAASDIYGNKAETEIRSCYLKIYPAPETKPGEEIKPKEKTPVQYPGTTYLAVVAVIAIIVAVFITVRKRM